MVQISSLDRPPDRPPKRPLRPLYGIPEPDRKDRTGFVLSFLLHALIITLMLLPPIVASQLDQEFTGGGGPGAAGGGGGGTGGTGGESIKAEKVRYLHVAPPAAAETKAPVTPAVVPPPPKPEPPEPEPEVTPTPVPEAVPAAAQPVTGPTIPTPGTGGGSGNDGSGGNGPGSGGGVGSGIGTGRGSGIGPGTGGGPGDIYPPQPTHLALLPIPVPSKVRPYKLVAWFDVDEKGNTTLISFNPTKDAGYNRKIRAMLAEVRFRPAVRADGTPVRDTVPITVEAPR